MNELDSGSFELELINNNDHTTKDELDDSVTNTTSVSLSDDDTVLQHVDTSSNNITSDTIQFHAPLRSDAWSEVSAKNLFFFVRGKKYMNDKMKQRSKESAFQLLAIDLVNTETPIYGGLCAHPDERIQTALREENLGIRRDNDEFILPEFVFAVNLCIPMNEGYSHAVFYFGADKDRMEEIKQETTPFGRVMNAFIYGKDDNFRDRSLKLIPSVVEGNYLIKHAIGAKPVILGKEMKQHYLREERYMEVIVDISSNTIASGITKLCLGYMNHLSIDLMFLIEGHDESTLPERILGGARINHLDFNTKDGKRTVQSY
eukprot:CAMPEP_0170895270 /NCGR_PEP_ID=MMETSP0734-20130129/43839_1 /TAXON_ID=186038 /ORGANISM="Fragilariopsis kerguelensis, Strain L26-C5" /LENGTH=316 /DNA_ID=CAMNT_0011286769 /DNA_START=36 /DNA_END=986 /DNA_ORIENTATION=+